MDIILSVLAVLVAATCLVALLISDIRERYKPARSDLIRPPQES